MIGSESAYASDALVGHSLPKRLYRYITNAQESYTITRGPIGSIIIIILGLTKVKVAVTVHFFEASARSETSFLYDSKRVIVNLLSSFQFLQNLPINLDSDLVLVYLLDLT